MCIEIKPVTDECRSDILKLSLYDSQKSFIETPSECLEEAKTCP